MTLIGVMGVWTVVSIPAALFFGRVIGINDDRWREAWKTPPPPLGDNVIRGPWRPRVVDEPVDAGWDWPDTTGDAA